MILLPVECLPKDAATQIGATSGVFPIDPRPLPGNKSWQPAGSAEFRISARPVPERAGETLRLFGGSCFFGKHFSSCVGPSLGAAFRARSVILGRPSGGRGHAPYGARRGKPRP
jgi:hypothetical protein